MRPTLLAVLLAGVWLGLGGLTGFAQTPTSTPSPPTPTPTSPPVVLAAPTEVRYDEQSNTVSWRDNASGEEGYRITVTISGETRVFEVGPDVEALQLPPDFRFGCPGNTIISIEVRAFLGASESEPGSSFNSALLCAPPTSTPMPGLPDTGSGGPADAERALPLALLVVVGVLALVVFTLGNRMSRG